MSALSHHLDAVWSGPCRCVLCDQPFDSDRPAKIHGNDAYCEDCTAIIVADETPEEE